MFDRFAAHLSATAGQPPGVAWRHPGLLASAAYEAFAGRYAGCSFDDGVYRVHDAVSGPPALAALDAAWPSYAGRATPFAFDWLGNHVALDSARAAEGEPLVLLFEPGTGEVLQVPVPFEAFHDQELVDHGDAALARDFFADWSAANAEALPLPGDRCAGYRVPLFLGGRDEPDNLELVDTEVYWSVSGDLLRGTAELPAGTRVSEVVID